MEISVLTAVYNGEDYLKESIDSILKQTFPNFEYIIVNDGSDDKTKGILDNVEDSRVKVIHLEKNVGAANALNIGIKEAKGKWIALQDSDDVSLENRLQMQLQYIQTDSRLVAVGSFIHSIPGKDPVDPKKLKKKDFNFNSRNNFRDEQFYRTPICNGTGFFLKSAYESIRGYNPIYKIAYDYDFWTRMFEVGEISRVPEVLYHYRVHGNSLSHQDQFATMQEVLLSTYKNISELRFKYLNRKPKLLLIGTKEKLNSYKERIEHENHFLTINYGRLDSNSIRNAYSLYLSNEIDGIILASQKRKLSRFFRNKGLLLGKNLFMVNVPLIPNNER